MKREQIFLVVLSAILNVVDRSTSTMAAACLVAALLGTVINPDKVATAYIGTAIFYLVAMAASITNALIEESDS